MAAETILSISLKEYKKEIDDLKGSLLGLKKGSDEYKSVLDEVRERESKLKEVMADVKKTADASEDTMNGLKQKLKELKQEIGNEKLGSDRFNELSKSILETTDKLKELEEAQGTFSRNVGNYESGVVSLKSQLKEITAQMAEMLSKGVSPSDEAFVALAKKAGDLKDSMSDANAVISHFANDTKGLATVVDLAKTGTAAFGAYKGVLAAFGVENENINNSLETLVGITTTLNSLQTLQTALVDRASITYRLYHGVISLASIAMNKLGLSTKETKAAEQVATATTNVHTGAITAQTIATKAATIATKALKVALASTGIGLIVVAVGELAAHWEDLVNGLKSGVKWLGKVTGLIKEQTAAEKAAAEATKKRAEEEKESQKTLSEMRDNNAKLMASFLQLKGVWESLSTVQEKTKFVEKYKNEMSSLGVEINNVNDAEKIFSTEGAKAFAQSLEMRARLAVIQRKLMRRISEQMRDEAEGKLQTGKTHGKSKLAQQYEDEIEDLKQQAVELTKMIDAIIPKTSASKTTKKDKSKIDISGDMEKFQRSLDEQITAIEYAYDLLSAKGEAVTKDEIDKANAIYTVTTNMIQREIEDRQKQLKNTKITAEQRKEIQDDLYKLEKAREDAYREHVIENEKLILKVRKDTLDNLNKSIEKSIKDENNAFKKSNLVSIYSDMLKDASPEVAASIVKMLSVSDEDKEQIIENLDILNGEQYDLIHQYYLKEEDAEYQHQLNLLNIQKDALVQMGIEFGEDSAEYLNQKQLVFNQEEEITRKHFANLTKIEKAHSDSTKRKRNADLGYWLDLGNGIADIMDSVAGIMEDDIKKKQENGEITEEEAKKQFETVKALEIVSATVNTLSGAIGAYTQAAKTFAPPYGMILGGINAAAITAAGIAQIAQIKAQQFGSSGNVGSGVATRNAVNVDFSGVQVNPLLDEQADINRLTTLSETQPSEQRVYILQSDIADSQKQVQIRQSNTTF